MVAGPVEDVVARLVSAVAPWQSLYADSRLVASAVLFTHLAALLVGGGLAIAGDRATLRVTGRLRGGDPTQRARHLDDLRSTHPPVQAALSLSLISGGLLALADLEEFARSPVFGIKLALVALLLANGVRLVRAERALTTMLATTDASTAGQWTALRQSAIASAALWLATVLAGVLLTNL